MCLLDSFEMSLLSKIFYHYFINTLSSECRYLNIHFQLSLFSLSFVGAHMSGSHGYVNTLNLQFNPGVKRPVVSLFPLSQFMRQE